MRLLNLRINFFSFIADFFVFILVVFFCCFFFHYVSAKFHLWPSSDDLLRPRIGMLSLVTVSSVITAFHNCCLSHHVTQRIEDVWVSTVPEWALSEDSGFQILPKAGQRFTWSKTWCDRQQLWKAVITGDTVYTTQHSYSRSQ